MLEPVSWDKKTVYLQLRNTSDQQQLTYQQPLTEAIAAKGYRIVEDPEQAHFWIQANILQISRTDLRSKQGRGNKGFGAAVQGAEIGGLFGGGDGQKVAVVVGGLIGIVTDALVEDVQYIMVTDIQIAEKVTVRVNEATNTQLEQGDASRVSQNSTEVVDRKKYQTRLTSTANKVNLSFEEVQQQLLKGLVQTMSGLL